MNTISNHVQDVLGCKTQPELNPIIATRPLELVHIHYLTIEPPANSKSDKDINILIITNHFNRYAQAHTTSSQKAQIVAKTLWNHFFVHYGFPKKILSDQGQNFESILISELCELTQIKKFRTIPYRPEGNGSCERFNRTFHLKILKGNGLNILVHLHMHITAPAVMQQDLAPIIYYRVPSFLHSQNSRILYKIPGIIFFFF